jgi:putative PIN family toxin of toxin-antitoxin system
MHVLLDTNTLIAGVISPNGAPRRLLDAARAQQFAFCTSDTLLAELLGVLGREKFASRLAQAGLTPAGIVDELRRLAAMVIAATSASRVVSGDADDDHVIAAAFFTRAELIVSGDAHLLSLKQYRDIAIVTAGEALQRIGIA